MSPRVFRLIALGNDPADEQFVVRLIERVTAVSLSTVKLLKDLPPKIEFSGLRVP